MIFFLLAAQNTIKTGRYSVQERRFRSSFNKKNRMKKIETLENIRFKKVRPCFKDVGKHQEKMSHKKMRTGVRI
jgi:hypothetical protein